MVKRGRMGVGTSEETEQWRARAEREDVINKSE